MRRSLIPVSVLLLLALACGGTPPSAPEERASVENQKPAATGTDAIPAPATKEEVPSKAAPPKSGTSSSPSPATVSAPPVVAPPPPPAASAPAKAAPAPSPEPPRAPATESTPKIASAPAPAATANSVPSLANNGHKAVGAAKCRMCHRTQHDSWSASVHAKKGLDCEACHGNGSDYLPMPIMKNAAAAKAAGLVMPSPDFCGKCHSEKATPAFLAKVHAHKLK